MSLTIDWPGIALRLFCSAIAGALIGLNRTSHGRAAGLRTMTLVSLAACVAMIQVNLLLSLAGKAPNSFISLDLMRLPLGILSGMGFIGGGAILRRGDMVVGVTTAAAMWFVTVLGLCFGGGQIMLGFAGLALGLFVLWGLRIVEERMNRDRLVSLSLTAEAAGPAESEVRRMLADAGLRINSLSVTLTPPHQELHFSVQWRSATESPGFPEVVNALARRPGVVRVSWNPVGR